MFSGVNRLEEKARIGKAGTLAVQLSRRDLVVLDELASSIAARVLETNSSTLCEAGRVLPSATRVETAISHLTTMSDVNKVNQPCHFLVSISRKYRAFRF
jgi:hypothetical protein